MNVSEMCKLLTVEYVGENDLIELIQKFFDNKGFID